MVAKLKLVANPPAYGKCPLSMEQLQALANSFVVALDPGDEIVHFGDCPPADTGKRWQEVSSTGAPVGKIKTYQNGVWA